MPLRTVTVENGRLEGVPGLNPAYTVYKGIPYAKPPVGELRWKAPQPAENWEGTRLCSSFSAIACQSPASMPGSAYSKEFYPINEPVSEDCLYLNVWTPAKSADEKLPVLFWVHGGAFDHGYGHEMEFDGEGFCKRGCILVTINYRVGALGFMAHPGLSAEDEHGVSGNYGTLDQIAALKWTKRNIAAFGGDPDNVTVFGQSAGARSVVTLTCSPLSRDLVDKAVPMSGGGLSLDLLRSATLASTEQNGLKLQALAGIEDLAGLRAADPMMLVELAAKNQLRFGPNVDGFVLEEEPSETMKLGKHSDCPYMIGNLSDEFRGMPVKNKAELEAAAQKIFGDKAPAFMKAAGVETDADAVRTAGEFATMHVANRAFVELQNALGRKPAWLYYFDRQMPGEEDPTFFYQLTGAFHSAELWYVFQTYPRCWRPLIGKDFELSELMADCWANFARSGDPNGETVPCWKPFTAEEPGAMHFGLENGMIPAPLTSAQRFITDLSLGKD